MSNASTVDILVRSAADVRALDLAVKRLQDLQTAATAVAGALANITQPLSQVLRAASEAQTQTVDAMKAAAQAAQDIGKATAAAQQQTAAAAQKAAQVAKAAEAESAKGVEKLQSRRRELADLTRKERDEAFKKLPVEEQLNQLLARRATIAERLVRAGENEARSLALRIAQARNETAIRAASARIKPAESATAPAPENLARGFQLGFGIDLSRRIVDGVLQLNAAIKNTIRDGITFNATLEDSALGIAAVLKQFNPQRFADFDSALKESERALESLKRKALESPASFSQLVQSFQAVTGAATSAGLSLDKQVDLIVLMSQALAGLDIRNEQIIQESRALITGNINEDAMAARILGITRQQVDAARQSGQLFEFLTGRLSAFAEAGRRGAANFTTQLSNVRDAITQLAGELTKPLFEAFKRELAEIQQLLANPKFKEDLAVIASGLTRVVKAAAGFSSDAIRGAVSAAGFADAAVSAGVYVAAIYGATKAVGLLSAGLAKLRGGFALVATGVSATAGAVAGLVSSSIAAKEGLDLWVAGTEEASAQAGFVAQTLRLERSIAGEMERRVKAGELAQQQADLYQRRMRFANEAVRQGIKTEGERYEIVKQISKELRAQAEQAINEPPPTPQKTEAQVEAQRKLAQAEENARLNIEVERLRQEEQLARTSYEQRISDLRAFMAERRRIAEAQADADIALLENSLDGADDAKRAEIFGQMELRRVQLEGEMQRIQAEGATEQRRIDQELAETRIQTLELTGQRLAAEEMRIQQQLAQLRQQGAAESDIAAIERLMTARARANAELEKTRGIQGEYSLQVAETNRLVQSGMITQTEAARRNDTAAREYEAALRKVLAVLIEIQEVNPDLSGIIDDIRELQAEIASAPPPTQEQDLSFGKGATDFLKSGIIDLENEAAIAGRIMQGTIGSAVNGIGDAITGLITRTATWGQVFAQVGVQIVSTLVKIGVEMIAQAALSKVLSLGAKTEAATTGASITSSMAPAAATTSAATFGGNTASIALTLGAIAAAAAAISSLAFAEGGLVPGAPSSRDNRIAAVATGEFINRASAVQYYGPGIFQALNEMRIPRASLDHLRVPVRPAISAGFAAGGLVGPMSIGNSAPPVVNVPPAQVHAVVLDDRQKFREYLESASGQTVIFNSVNRMKTKLGIPS